MVGVEVGCELSWLRELGDSHPGIPPGTFAGTSTTMCLGKRSLMQVLALAFEALENPGKTKVKIQFHIRCSTIVLPLAEWR